MFVLCYVHCGTEQAIPDNNNFNIQLLVALFLHNMYTQKVTQSALPILHLVAQKYYVIYMYLYCSNIYMYILGTHITTSRYRN